MEFETKFDKYAFFTIIPLMLIGVVWFFVHMHNLEVKSDQERAEYELTHPRIVFGDYVKLTRIDCRTVEKMYPKEYLRGLDHFHWSSISCAETYSGFYLKYSLIRYKQEMFQVYIKLADKTSPSEVLEFNVPYCVIGTDKAEFTVNEECSRIP